MKSDPQLRWKFHARISDSYMGADPTPEVVQAVIDSLAFQVVCILFERSGIEPSLETSEMCLKKADEILRNLEDWAEQLKARN